MECAKVQTGIRKSKKKQVKDELDRIKQAEKKKRRLEKALATSAAICSELEKKKQKKKEEQQRLDEEGAAIAEAVALHVLLDEDSEDPHQVMRDHCSSFDQELSQYSLEFSDAHRYGYMWMHQGNSDWIVSSGPQGRDFLGKYFEDEGWYAAGLSPGLIAAQAVSSLQIADDSNIDTYLFNRMLNG